MHVLIVTVMKLLMIMYSTDRQKQKPNIPNNTRNK
uniref:Uncharacterized protein n=1 Tax=Anopheles quadriannulatus TaxID=34691 RepID=A0A182XTL3_ANOQN